MKLCMKRDCPNEGTHAIRLCVPAVASPEHAPAAASILVGVQVCEEHLEADDPQGWVTGDTGRQFRQLLAVAAAGMSLDFDRAYTCGVSVHSPEYQALMLNAPGKPN